MKHSRKIIPCLILAATVLTACSKPYLRYETADRITGPAWMIKREIPAGPFALTAYERMHRPGEPATLYIEGDGKAWVSKSMPSRDPTPANPLALHLAAMDKSKNVAYLARPCQFSGMVDKTAPCDVSWWTTNRFAPDVIAAYNQALDEIKKRYEITNFNLVGYSGGGAIAAVLAGQRDDVISLRTVAGNLDPAAFAALHGVTPPPIGSASPVDYAARLREVPQIHFIGGQDEIVPQAVLTSYLQKAGASQCIQQQMIQEATHDSGWTDKWPELLRIMPQCGVGVVGVSQDFAPVELPADHTEFHVSPEKPEKP